MASTPYQTTDTIIKASDLTALATTGASSSTPYGFTTAAQADAIVTQVNLIISLLKYQGLGPIE